MKFWPFARRVVTPETNPEVHTMAATDLVVPILRPEGSERPIGRLLRNVYFQPGGKDRPDLVLLFDGFKLTIQAPGPVTTEDSDD
jgi:hypothetical protein